MADRTQSDVRVRLSAEGQAEVINAFRQVQREAERSGKGAGGALGALSDRAQSLGSTIRGVSRVIKGLGLLAIVHQVQAVLPEVAKLIDALRGIDESAVKAGEAAVAFNKKLAQALGLDLTRDLPKVREELTAQRRTLEELTIKWLPGWAQAAANAARGTREEFLAAKQRVAELGPVLDELTLKQAAAGKATEDSAKKLLASLQQEVALLGKTEAERIQILHLRQLATVADLRSRGAITQEQQNEIVNLLNARRAHELNALAAKTHAEQLKALGIELVRVNQALGEFQRERPTLLRQGESREITSTAEAFERLVAAVSQFRKESTGISAETFAEDAKRLLKAPPELTQTAPTPIATQLDESRLEIFERAAQTIRDISTAGELAIQRAAELREEFEAGALTAEQYERALQQVKDSLTGTGVTAERLGQTIQQSITVQFTNFFTTGIQDADSFGDAMRSLALNVIQSLQQIVAQMLINIAVSRLLGGIFGAFGGGSFTNNVQFGGVGSVAAAGGGLIRGPGTGASDSIPAWLSDHEFVVQSSVVRQPGVLEALRELNAGGFTLRRRRGFAEGGLVEADGAAGGGAAIGTLHIDARGAPGGAEAGVRRALAQLRAETVRRAVSEVRERRLRSA